MALVHQAGGLEQHADVVWQKRDTDLDLLGWTRSYSRGVRLQAGDSSAMPTRTHALIFSSLKCGFAHLLLIIQDLFLATGLAASENKLALKLMAPEDSAFKVLLLNFYAFSTLGDLPKGCCLQFKSHFLLAWIKSWCKCAAMLFLEGKLASWLLGWIKRNWIGTNVKFFS